MKLREKQGVSMLVECISIVMIILLMAVVFLRAHRKDYAVTTLPLLILPLLHIFSLWAAKPISRIFPLEPAGVMVAIDATALIISCTALGFFSHRITAKKPRMVYLLFCGIFVTILTWVLISNTLVPMQ